MDGAKNPDGDSTATRRLSSTLSIQTDQDDAYMQAMAMTVSDGFRPALSDVAHSQGDSSGSSYVTNGSESPPSTPRHPNPTSPSPPSRPSSIAKAPGSVDSFALQNDGPNFSQPASSISRSLPRESTGSASVTSGSSTTTDSMPPLGNESPYQGPSGPSHPYQMYNQDVRVARTMSVMTSSTTGPPVPPDQPYSGPRGPAHPYAMYSQNTVVPQQSAVDATGDGPVGFPGVGTDVYRRRIGPEGEEAGLIGPLGHTEELPPYTRYPDEQIARKVRDVEAAVAESSQAALPSQPAAAVTSAPRAAAIVPPPVQPIPGAGGIGIAARNPEFDSVDDLESPRSRHSTRSFTSTSEASHHEINTAAAAIVSEKEPRRWESRKRLCGIFPCWVVILAITAVLVIGLILGAVLGSVLGKPPKRGPPDRDRDSQPPSIYDAIPVPAPLDLAPLPRGSFGLPLKTQREPNTCFNDTTQAQAWSCMLAFPPVMAMTMSISGGENGAPYGISMTSSNESLSVNSNMYSWGAQPPMFPKGVYPMQTVNDSLEPTRGTAWFKMMPFNKTVVLPESMLSATSGKTVARSIRRGTIPAPPSFDDIKRKFSAQPGDKPWLCTWPETVLEIFIYPGQNASIAKSLYPPEKNSEKNAVVLSQPSGSPLPSATRASFGSGSGASESGSSNGGAPTTASAGTRTSSVSTSLPSGMPSLEDMPPLQPIYPRVVKIEERRIQGSPAPVCRQLKIESDGKATANFDASGRPIEVRIVEVGNTPPLEGEQRQKKEMRPRDGGFSGVHERLVPRDSSDLSDCGCVWFLT